MSNKSSPAFQLYAQDFLTGVIYLTNEETGMYIKMLAKQWTDGKIPKKRLGFLVGYEWDSFSEELKGKFNDQGEFVFNERLEKEREKRNNFLEKQAKNGSKGGRPTKKDETQKKGLGYFGHNPSETQKKPLEDENEIEDEIENNNKGAQKKSFEVDQLKIEIWPTFDDFWDLYDKKRDRPKCEKIWKELGQSEKESIMDYLPDYKISQPEKQFRKDPQTFLRNRSWENELIFNNQSKNGQQKPKRDINKFISAIDRFAPKS